MILPAVHVEGGRLNKIRADTSIPLPNVFGNLELLKTVEPICMTSHLC